LNIGSGWPHAASNKAAAEAEKRMRIMPPMYANAAHQQPAANAFWSPDFVTFIIVIS
jgi:hypothetical protein